MTRNDELQSNVRELWELSVRLENAAQLIGYELRRFQADKLRIDHAIHAQVLAQHLKWILRACGDVGGFVPYVSRRMEADSTSRKTVSNAKRTLKLQHLSKPAMPTTADCAYLYLQALQVADEAVAMCLAAQDNGCGLTVASLQVKLQTTSAKAIVLQEKYRAASATTENVYLMSFVDHLLVSAKAVFEEPSEDDYEASVSNWDAMQKIERTNAQRKGPPKEVEHQCGAVDVDVVVSSVTTTVNDCLSAGDNPPAHPIGAMVYSLILLELAADITAKSA